MSQTKHGIESMFSLLDEVLKLATPIFPEIFQGRKDRGSEGSIAQILFSKQACVLLMRGEGTKSAYGYLEAASCLKTTLQLHHKSGLGEGLICC